MTKKGDMLYAWTNDAEIQKKAELGGAVTCPVEICPRVQDG